MLNKLLNKYKIYKNNKQKTPCTVCRCYDVNSNDISVAINNGCKDISDIRKVTKAGTACGRCNASVERHVSKSLKKQALK